MLEEKATGDLIANPEILFGHATDQAAARRQHPPDLVDDVGCPERGRQWPARQNDVDGFVRALGDVRRLSDAEFNCTATGPVVRLRVLESGLIANESDDRCGERCRSHNRGTGADTAVKVQHTIVPANEMRRARVAPDRCVRVGSDLPELVERRLGSLRYCFDEKPGCHAARVELLVCHDMRDTGMPAEPGRHGVTLPPRPTSDVFQMTRVRARGDFQVGGRGCATKRGTQIPGVLIAEIWCADTDDRE